VDHAHYLRAKAADWISRAEAIDDAAVYDELMRLARLFQQAAAAIEMRRDASSAADAALHRLEA
jgi:hypothetical protein